MKTIQCICDWCDPTILMKMAQRHDVGFRNITFTDSPEADYYVIFNGAYQPYDPERALFFQMEPAPLRSPKIPPVKYDFSIPKHHMPVTIGFGCNRTALELAQPMPKSKLICSVLSNKQALIGQKRRVEFAHRLKKELPGFDLTGDIIGVPTTKYDYLPPYKYTFTAENIPEINYFTEKIVDAIVCESLCFYWGCPNISDFLDSRAYIVLPDNPAEWMNVVRTSIQNNEWEKRLPYILKEKYRIIFDMQFYAWLDRFIGNLGKPA